MEPTYDLILTSETLYSRTSIPKLVRLIVEKLGREGIALVASKNTYFGLDGGMVEFTDFFKANFPEMQLEVVCSKGQVAREIVKITRRIVEE